MNADPDVVDDAALQGLVDSVEEGSLIRALVLLPRAHRLVVACRLALELGDDIADRRELRRFSAELSATGIGRELAEALPLTLRREQERAARRRRRTGVLADSCPHGVRLDADAAHACVRRECIDHREAAA